VINNLHEIFSVIKDSFLIDVDFVVEMIEDRSKKKIYIYLLESRSLVGARFFHRVAVDDFAENFYGFVNRRACEAAVSRVRKKITLCKFCHNSSRQSKSRLCRYQSVASEF